MFALKGGNLCKDEHPPHFPLKHASKDMRFASALAKEKNVEFGVNDAATAIFKKAEADFSEGDFSWVFSEIKERRG